MDNSTALVLLRYPNFAQFHAQKFALVTPQEVHHSRYAFALHQGRSLCSVVPCSLRLSVC